MKPISNSIYGILILLSFSINSGFSQNLSRIAEPLRSKLPAMTDTEKEEIMIVLNDQVDLETLGWQFDNANTGKHDRSIQTITALQNKATTTQTSIIQFLNSQGGNVTNIEPLWVVNMVIAKATKGVIEQISAMNSVSSIYPDGELITDSDGFFETSSTTTYNPTPNLEVINADELWNLGYYGSGALVMNIDGGVEVNHPALYNKWRGNHGFSANQCWYDPVRGTTTPSEIQGATHGTHTMGIMVGGTATQTVGVAPDALWISANNGISDIIVNGNTIGYSLKCLQWALNPDGNIQTSTDIPDVVSCSFHESFSYYDCGANAYMYWYARRALETIGTALVFSAGNSGPNEMSLPFPQIIPEIFSVGNLNTSSTPFEIRPSSARGPSLCDESVVKPNVVAPGTYIESSICIWSGTTKIYDFGTMSGTSMAVPHIAGSIALLKSAFPEKTGVQLRDALVRTAVPYGTPVPNNTYGAGLIDVYAAFQYLLQNEKEILVAQKKSTGQNTSTLYLGKWDGTRFIPILNNSVIRSKVGTSEILSGSFGTDSGEKYKYWKKGTTPDSDIKNHHIFPITNTTEPSFTSQFIPFIPATLQATADGLLTGSGLQIKDPWLRDFQEYYVYRNRGMDAVWTTLTTTNLGGSPVDGVFSSIVNPISWSGNYYRVKAPSFLSINGIQSQFLNWSVPSGTVEFQNAMTEPETGIDFETSGAIVQANYKAMLASKTTGWVSNQFASNNGTSSVMYVSEGKLWLHRENGSDKKEILVSSSAGSISSYSVTTNGNNRYWVLNNGTTTPVSGYELNGATGVATVPALSGLSSSSRIEIVRINSTTPKLALITKVGTAIYKSIGT